MEPGRDPRRGAPPDRRSASLHDFGETWEHKLTVAAIRQGEPGVAYPRYTGGEWNAPPEDCGGIPGFYETLNAIADPDDPDHRDAAEWFDDYPSAQPVMLGQN